MVGAIHTALSFALKAIVTLLSHPAVQSGLRKAALEGTKEVIRHVTSSRTQSRVDRVQQNRA